MGDHTEGKTADALDAAYGALLTLLDNEKHDDDCAFRCLNINGCRGDHGCTVCGADDDDEGQGKPE